MEDKTVKWCGNSRKDIRSFPERARLLAGFELMLLQKGEQATDFKPMKTVGRAVYELRIKDESNQFRIFYIAKFTEAIYVLHAFQKTNQKTPNKDLDLAKSRYKDLISGRKAMKNK